MTMAAIFLAQATDTPLTLGHQLTLARGRDALLERARAA